MKGIAYVCRSTHLRVSTNFKFWLWIQQQSRSIEQRVTSFIATPWYRADRLLKSPGSNVVLASILPVNRPEEGQLLQYDLRWYRYAVLASTKGRIAND